jgi:single-strand DNA-binding protein
MSGSSLNKCQFIGNLGKDPEVRRTNDGRPVVNLSLGCSERWKDKSSGEDRERTEWVRIVIFNEGLAQVAEKYLKKGDYVYIEGQLQTRKWQDQSGNDRYSTEVVLQNFRGELRMLESKAGKETRYRDEERAMAGAAERAGIDQQKYGDHRGGAAVNGSTGSGTGAMSGGGRHDMDDEIPFHFPLHFFWMDNREDMPGMRP